MTEAELQETVRKLAPKRGQVYAAILELGPATDLEISHAVDPNSDPGAARTRRAELVKAGLVRTAGKRGKQRTWQATPAADVESARQAAPGRGSRLLDIGERPLEVRVRAFQRLARDPEVQEAINDPASAAHRRDRARLREVLRRDERERRERSRELRSAAERGEAHVEFIRFRNALRDAVDRVRAIRVLLEEQIQLGADLPATMWVDVADLLVEGIRHHENAYEAITRVTGQPSRKQVDLEYGEDEIIEDAEVLELIAAAGEDAAPHD